MPGLITEGSRSTARGGTMVGTAPTAPSLTRERQSLLSNLWLSQNSDQYLESIGEASGGSTGGSTLCPSSPGGSHRGNLRHHHHRSASSTSLLLLDKGHQHQQHCQEVYKDGPAAPADHFFVMGWEIAHHYISVIKCILQSIKVFLRLGGFNFQ